MLVERIAPIGPGNHGPLVDILTWFLMVMMILSVVTRLGIRYSTTGSLRLDDYTMCAALALGIGQGIATSLEVSYGLGKYQNTLDASQVTSVLKAQYVGDLLYVATLCVAQVSSLQLIEWLAALKWQKQVAQWTSFFNIGWSTLVVFILAFHGGLPRPWSLQSGRGIDLYIFWIIVTVIGLLLELTATILPILVILPVQMQLYRRLVIILAFAFRLCVIAALLARIFFLKGLRSSDFTYDGSGLAIATQVVLSIAVTTASVPALKPLLDSAETGLLGASLHGRAHQTSPGASYKLSQLSQNGGHIYQGGHGITATTVAANETAASSRRKVSESSDEMRIVKVAHWEVQYESADSGSRSIEGDDPDIEKRHAQSTI